MAKRYTDIRRGARLAAALTHYSNYLNTSATRPRKLNTRGPMGLDKTLYVAPFTTQVAATEKCMAKCRQAAFTMISPSILAGTSKADVKETLGTDTLIAIPKFKASRIVLFHNSTRQVAVKPSELTGQDYLKYTGDTLTCPFGATVDADDEMEGFLDVKAHLLTALAASAVKRVSLKREYVGVD